MKEKEENLFNLTVVYKTINDKDTGMLRPNGNQNYTLYIDPTCSLEIQTKTFYHEMTHLFARLLSEMVIRRKKVRTKSFGFIITQDLAEEEKVCKSIEQMVWQELKNLRRSRQER